MSAQVWKTKADADSQLLAWKVLHHKLPVGDKLKYITVQPIRCHFCLHTEDMKHIFWDCHYVKKLWSAIFKNFSAIFHHKWNWKEALLGFGLHNDVIVDSIRQVILRHIWKTRCSVVFSGNYLQERGILILYSDVVFQVAFLLSQISNLSKRNLLAMAQLQQLKDQVNQLQSNCHMDLCKVFRHVLSM